MPTARPRPRPRPRPEPPPDVGVGDTELILDDIANLLSVVQGTGGSRRTKVLVFKGPQTSGTPIGTPATGLGFDGTLFFMLSTSACLITLGRTWASMSASAWDWSGLLGYPTSNGGLILCAHDVVSTDRIYVDSVGGLGTSDAVTLGFYVN